MYLKTSQLYKVGNLNNQIVNICFKEHENVFKDELTANQLKILITLKRIEMYIFCVNGSPAGYIICRKYKGCVNIDYLSVFNEYRGKGYAGVILNDILSDNNYTDTLTTLECVPKMSCFYEKYNFSDSFLIYHKFIYMTCPYIPTTKAKRLRLALYNEFNIDLLVIGLWMLATLNIK